MALPADTKVPAKQHDTQADRWPKVVELYTQEANGGRSAAWAMSGLAHLYATGSGVEKSYETAADWCNKSLAAACPGDDGIVEYANSMLAQIAESSQHEAQG